MTLAKQFLSSVSTVRINEGLEDSDLDMIFKSENLILNNCLKALDMEDMKISSKANMKSGRSSTSLKYEIDVSQAGVMKYALSTLFLVLEVSKLTAPSKAGETFIVSANFEYSLKAGGSNGNSLGKVSLDSSLKVVSSRKA